MTHVEFGSGLHIVMGENAQGKTSLLEAIYWMATGRILRGMKDSEAIRAGSTIARVEAEVAPHGTLIRGQLEIGSRKKMFLNHVALPRASDVLGRLPCVVFSNLDLAIVRGDASDRRTFLDTELSQMSPLYFRSLASYRRALEQRNALLKHAQTAEVQPSELLVWDEHLAEHGAALRQLRLDFVRQLNQAASEIHSEFASGEVLHLSYAPQDSSTYAEELQAALLRERGVDLRRGTTTIGPHRDELQIEVAGKSARLFGSMGQQRTAALALKLAVTLQLAEIFGDKPLLLLDDVLSELDQGRREHILAWTQESASQILLTCNELAQAGARATEQAAVFRVEAGSVTKQ